VRPLLFHFTQNDPRKFANRSDPHEVFLGCTCVAATCGLIGSRERNLRERSPVERSGLLFQRPSIAVARADGVATDDLPLALISEEEADITNPKTEKAAEFAANGEASPFGSGDAPDMPKKGSSG
jgi:hypothetical protein